MALVTAGPAFRLRRAATPDLQKKFFDPLHAAHATALVGGATGAAFLGFAVSIFIGSPLCDYMGMGRLLAVSVILFFAGTIGTILAPASANVYYLLWATFFTVGLGHGLVEAVINP